MGFEDEDAVDRCCADHFVNLNGKQVRGLLGIKLIRLDFQ